MNTRQRVSFNIRKYRQEKSLSQEELGFEADLHRTYISMLERGTRSPTIDVLDKIAVALGIPLARLVE
jgi:transcriptional regulator with XRE-family HTH domain